MRLPKSIFASLLLLATIPTVTSACSVFVIVRDGKVLFCNNEDYIKPGFVWLSPASEGELGRINFGFEDGFVQGSMNEAGLAFDGLALSKIPWSNDAAKESPENLVTKIMSECQTVEQAISNFEKYNCRFLANSQILFADATGDAAVISGASDGQLSITRISDDRLIATNTRLETSGYRCQRYTRIDQMLDSDLKAGIPELAEVLDAVHQQGPGAVTTYSNIYDLKHQTVTVFNLAQFDAPIEVDLKKELLRLGSDRRTAGQDGETEATGPGFAAHPKPLAQWFENGERFDMLRASEPIADYGTGSELDAVSLQRCAGDYTPRNGPDVVFQIKVKGNELVVINPGQPAAALFPESANRFRIKPDRGQVTFQFDNGEDHPATGLILHKQIDLPAVRVAKDANDSTTRKPLR